MKTLIYIPVKAEEALYFVTEDNPINREEIPVKPVEISEDDIIDTFQEYSSQSIFDHNLMTENDFYKAITKLMKGEK